jgi:hypothetical protein
LDLIGNVRFERGDFMGAAHCFAEEARERESVGEVALASFALGNLAEALFMSGDIIGAARAQGRCLETAVQLGAPREVAYSMHLAGRIAAHHGNWVDAVAFIAAADVQLDALGVTMYPSDRMRADEVLTAARHHLGAEQFDAVRRNGLEQRPEQLIARVIDFLNSNNQPPKEHSNGI